MVNPLHKQIELQNIKIIRNQKTILTANISVPLEGITAIIGPNGSGKTTFLKLVHGLIDFDSGNYLPGADKLRSALVLHHTPLIRASVRTNLAIIRDTEDIHSISDADIDLALADVGLLNLAEQSALKLSAGERQRLSLARAKLQNSKTILLDEPTANLDPSSTDQMEIIIKKLAGQGSSIIFTSHNLAQVERLAKQIIFISKGSCSEVIDKDVFFKNPPSKDAESFLHHELGWL